jgi:hypothetical protein
MPSRGALVFGTLLFVAIAAAWFAPFMTRDRLVVASTPTVRPFFQLSVVPLPAGGRACVQGVIFEPSAQAAQVQVTSLRRGGPRLDLTASAPGYTASGTLAPGYGEGAVVTIGLSRVSGQSRVGRLCLINRGRHAIGLAGTAAPRSLSSSAQVTVNGRRAPAQISLTMVQRAPSSLLHESATILERAAAFRPVGRGVLWPLALLVAFAVPLLVLVALSRALREDCEQAPGR